MQTSRYPSILNSSFVYWPIYHNTSHNYRYNLYSSLEKSGSLQMLPKLLPFKTKDDRYNLGDKIQGILVRSRVSSEVIIVRHLILYLQIKSVIDLSIYDIVFLLVDDKLKLLLNKYVIRLLMSVQC
jgi:hypothetical protein